MPTLLKTNQLFLIALLSLVLFTGCGGEEPTDNDKAELQTEASEDQKDEAISELKPGERPEGWTELEASADECGETMAKYIDLINKYSAVYGEYVENPDDEALQKRVDELSKAAEPLQKEIEEKGRVFYAENYDTDCWATYNEAVRRLSINVSKAAGKMIEQKMPEIQKELEEATKQLENLEY